MLSGGGEKKDVLDQSRRMLINGYTVGSGSGSVDKKWALDVKHEQAHRTKNEKVAMTREQNHVMEGNEDADE